MNIISSLLAKVSTILMILTIGIWALRAGIEKGRIKKEGRLGRAYERLKRSHQLMGKLLILAALVHGIMSSEKLFSLNWGTACWAAAIIIGITAAFKKEDNEKLWKAVHRAISILAFALMIVHIVTVV